jgi:hypothetical protein
MHDDGIGTIFAKGRPRLVTMMPSVGTESSS